MRTHYCGLIDENLIDQTVTLCGWVDRRRDHGGVIFLDMRDREGVVQVVFDPDTEEHFQRADSVRSEYVLRITGRVRARAAETVNPNMASGEIEVLEGRHTPTMSDLHSSWLLLLLQLLLAPRLFFSRGLFMCRGLSVALRQNLSIAEEWRPHAAAALAARTSS